MIPTPAPEIVTQIVDDEALLLDTASQKIHHLNGTARVIWEHCEIGSTVEKIVFEFIQIYEVDEQTARRDIEHTLSSWVEMGLIAPTPE